MSIIKYGTSVNYIPDWGYKEAVREIVQNFRDYGDYDEHGDTSNIIPRRKYRTYSSDYVPDSLEFLKIGISKKSSADCAGGHGEGMKWALLVLKRLNMFVSISFTNKDGEFIKLRPTFYEDESIGECFGIGIIKGNSSEFIYNNFNVTIQCDEELDAEMTDYFINEEDVLFSCNYGEIVDKPKGNIYVGGIFVLNKENVPRSYNLKASNVKIGRNRDIPSDYDVSSNISYVYEEYLKEYPEEFTPDIGYTESFSLYELPDEVVEDIEPVMNHGELRFKKGDTLISDNYTSAVKDHSLIKDKVKKIKIMLHKRKSPLEMIEKFRETYKYSLNRDASTELDIIIEKMKDL